VQIIINIYEVLCLTVALFTVNSTTVKRPVVYASFKRPEVNVSVKRPEVRFAIK